MPIVSSANEAGDFLVTRLFGRVTTDELLESNVKTAEMVTRGSAFCTLLLFDSSLDLSQLDAAGLNAVRRHRKQQFEELNLYRRAGAAVVDLVRDARIMLPLWNALSDSDPEHQLRFQMFYDVAAALDWLGIDETGRLDVIARTGFMPAD